jgi:DNA-directed RNA polymerase specialized sigma24 family protein
MSQTEAATGTPDSQCLHDAVVRDYAALCGIIAGMRKRRQGVLRLDQRQDSVEEIANEAVKRALERADDFDPRRSAMAWLTGFAANVLREQHPGRRRRPVSQSDVGEEAWQAGLNHAFIQGDGEESPDVSLVHEALGRLSADQQRVLQLGLVQGLDSAAIARATGAPTPGAARVQKTRALAALRESFKQCAGEKEQLP